MERKIAGCPLGAKCEEVKDDVIYVCPWFVEVRGKDPQTGDEINDWKCAIAWTPIMIIENSNQQRSTASAVESFRNEVINKNDQLGNMLIHIANTKNLIKNT